MTYYGIAFRNPKTGHVSYYTGKAGGEPDEDILHPNETETMDTVFSVDESTIYFHKASPFSGKPGGKTHFAVIILGNGGYDCIADHSCSNHALAYDDFEQVMDQVQEWADKFDDGAMGES